MLYINIHTGTSINFKDAILCGKKKSFFKDVQTDSIENYTQLSNGKHVKTYVLAKVSKETYEFLHSTQ